MRSGAVPGVAWLGEHVCRDAPVPGVGVERLEPALLRQVAENEQLWAGLADRILKGDEAALQQVPELRDKVDNWIVRGAQHLVGQYGPEITTIITDTIERWDAEEASERIELHVGRDLQFIRINGTVVGALAGLVIYTVAQLLF